MRKRFATFLAILAAVGVAAPPMLFCRMSGCDQAAAAPLKKACCSHCLGRHQHPRQTDSLPAPARTPGCPVCQFCAQHTSVIPAKRVQRPETTVFALHVVMCEMPTVITAPVDRASFSLSPERPPTHLLHCVWQC
jgi:hypothetical protein